MSLRRTATNRGAPRDRRALLLALVGCASTACAAERAPSATPEPPRPIASRAPAPATTRESATTADRPDPALLALEAPPPPPEAHHPFQDPVLPPQGKAAPASRYANLYPAGCQAELRKRKLPLKRDRGPAKGIATPLRFDGSLGGVRYVTPGAKSVFGKLDCRLALTLDDLAPILVEHSVTEVRVDNMYRPHAHLPGRRKPSQHSYGLAIDIVSMTLADGRVLVVEDDWRGTIGDKPCGPESQLVEPTDNTVALRNVVCAIARTGLFHHMLTPNYNDAHENHLHFDIKRDEKRSIIE